MDLEAMIDRYRGPLVGLLVSWGASWADAVELAQDSFSEAYLRRDRCRGDLSDPRQFGGWLFGIAKNLHRNHARSLRRHGLQPSSDPREIPEESIAEDSQRAAAVRAEIDRLPDKLRRVVLMHYLEETSIREVASLLRLSERSVEGRLYRARKLLRERLEPGLSSGTSSTERASS